MNPIYWLLVCCAVFPFNLCAQDWATMSADEIVEHCIKHGDPGHVDDLRRFSPEQAIPAYYKLCRQAPDRVVRNKAELLMLSVPIWDTWFLDQVWALLPGSLYNPIVKEGDPVFNDPERMEPIRKAAERAHAQREAARDLIEYLARVRSPKAIRILGPITFLDGDDFGSEDVGGPPPNDAAESSLYNLEIYGFPNFAGTEAVRRWWLKNQDLTDAQWWELLRRGKTYGWGRIIPSIPEARSNPSVTPLPVVPPKPAIPAPASRGIRRADGSSQ